MPASAQTCWGPSRYAKESTGQLKAMIFTKLGVSQKQASSQANAAAAKARHASNSGSPHAARRSRRQEMARANAATQLVNGIAAKSTAASRIRGVPRLLPANHTASS